MQNTAELCPMQAMEQENPLDFNEAAFQTFAGKYCAIVEKIYSLSLFMPANVGVKWKQTLVDQR